jgi:hypothetical protein
MAKEPTFKIRKHGSKKLVDHPAPAPIKFTAHRLRQGDVWTAPPTASKVTKERSGRSAKKPKVPKRALDVLRCEDGLRDCLHCGKTSDEGVSVISPTQLNHPDICVLTLTSQCTTKCYTAFKREEFLGANQVEIGKSGPGMGYGAFIKPGVTIAKGQ